MLVYGQIERLHLLQQEDLNSLNVLHVTGTKGKGSTCAFVDSILRHTKPGWKIGELHLIRWDSLMLNPYRLVYLATPCCSAGANTCQRDSHIRGLVRKILF